MKISANAVDLWEFRAIQQAVPLRAGAGRPPSMVDLGAAALKLMRSLSATQIDLGVPDENTGGALAGRRLAAVRPEAQCDGRCPTLINPASCFFLHAACNDNTKSQLSFEQRPAASSHFSSPPFPRLGAEPPTWRTQPTGPLG